MKRKKITTEIFIQRGINKHKTHYNYDKTEYIEARKKVCITCTIHNHTFWIRPKDHVDNVLGGCIYCKKDRFRDSTEEFIEKAIKLNKNKYNYSKVDYVNNKTPVIIICNECGHEYPQRPDLHLYCNAGCPFCATNQKLTQEEFLERANNISGHICDYSKFIYIDCNTNGLIICKGCGNNYYKVPNAIYLGQTCPSCTSKSFISKVEIEFFDYINIPKCHRQKRISKYWADAYDPITNTIYEFLGDYWHGNLEIFDPSRLNTKAKHTFKELNENTFKRFDKLKAKGYKIKYIWENSWTLHKKDPINHPLILLDY